MRSIYSFITGIVIGSIATFILMFNGCQDHPAKINPLNKDSIMVENNNAKQRIKALQSNNDSLIGLVDSLDKHRSIAVPKWKKQYTEAKQVIENSNCDSVSKGLIMTAVNIVQLSCDSIISNDSLEINNLKLVIKNDQDIFKNYEQRLTLDSMIIENNIAELRSAEDDTKQAKKALRRQKVKTWLVGAAGVVSTGLTAFLLLK